jgi:hypothetical protein
MNGIPRRSIGVMRLVSHQPFTFPRYAVAFSITGDFLRINIIIKKPAEVGPAE